MKSPLTFAGNACLVLLSLIPSSAFAQSDTIQIGSGGGNSMKVPIHTCFNYNYSQQIYLASEYQGNTHITDIAFKYLGGGTNLPNWQHWTVYIANTSQSSFSSSDDWVPFALNSEAFDGTITPVEGEWMNITLAVPFDWDGTSNIVVAIHENSLLKGCTAHWASFNSGAGRSLVDVHDIDDPDPAALTPASYGPLTAVPQLRIIGMVPVHCDALPDPGATLGPDSVCPGTDFILSTENTGFEAGISRQWEVSTDGVNWTNAPGNSTQHNYHATQTEDTWYRVEVTCDNTGTAASTPLHVLTNTPLQCYCTTIDFQYTVEPICNVTFAGIDNTSSGTVDGSPAYEDFTNTPAANVIAGYDFPISVTGNPNSGQFPSQLVIYFDWDQDGVFETSQNLGTISGSPCTTPTTGTIAVPASALPGTSRMRVIKSKFALPYDPCIAYNEGQAEDYLVTVDGAVPCSTLPDPGATTGPASICPLDTFSLSFPNVDLNSGLTYQWETSTDGIVWADAPGNSTAPTYITIISDTTWFRAQVTCAFTGATASTPLEVTLIPPLECYCPPPIFTFEVNPICNVTFADLDHGSDGTIGGSPGYEDFSDQTANVQRGHVYPFTVSGTVAGTFGATGYVDAFFDWNQDGTFETYYYVGSFEDSFNECDSSASFNLTVPADAALGTSRMRVILQHDNFASDPCEDQTQFYGQVEEYTINVLNDVGVAELTGANGIAGYPNPASTVLHISTPEGRPMNVKVLDITGNLVMDRAQVRDLDISKLAAGSYVLVATEKDGTHAVHARFVKQ